MVTLREIAKEAGVSTYTVSRVLNGLASQSRISEQRAVQIQDIANRLGFRPNSAARAMRQQKTRQLGVLIRNNAGDRYTHPLAFETICGINEGLEPEGFVLSIVRIGEVADGQESRVFREQVLDGMFVIDSLPDHLEKRVEQLVPNVVWADAGIMRDVNCVRRDEMAAGALAARHVANLGYKRAVWFGIPERSRFPRHYSLFERREGVRRTCREAGVELVEVEQPDDDRYAISHRLAGELRGDTCVIVYDTYRARWLQSFAAGARRRPGWDFGLVCCDDAHSNQVQWPGLSRATFDRYELGLTASRLMHRVMEGGRAESVSVGCTWHPGDTAWGPRPD